MSIPFGSAVASRCLCSPLQHYELPASWNTPLIQSIACTAAVASIPEHGRRPPTRSVVPGPTPTTSSDRWMGRIGLAPTAEGGARHASEGEEAEVVASSSLLQTLVRHHMVHMLLFLKPFDVCPPRSLAPPPSRPQTPRSFIWMTDAGFTRTQPISVRV